MKPPHRAAKQMGLVDGLGSSNVEQFRWTICGDHEHRDAGEIGFDNSRVEVGAGGPRRAQHHRGATCCHPVPERREPCRALVVEDLHPNTRMGSEC
jgi:hypothetical protein